MKIALLLLSAVCAAPALADDAPYVLRNGRAQPAPSAAPAPASIAAAAPAIPAASGSPAPHGSLGKPSGSNFGSRNVHPTIMTPGRVGSGARNHIAGTGGRGLVRGDGNAPPPNYSKPGALIRTEGQLPVYTDPGNARTFGVDGGGFITKIEEGRAVDVGRAPGMKYGAPDKAPPPNGSTTGSITTSGTGIGANGVKAGVPPIPSGGSGGDSNGNSNGNGSSNDGGGDGHGDGHGGDGNSNNHGGDRASTNSAAFIGF